MSEERGSGGEAEDASDGGWLGLGPANYALFGAAAVAIVLGYVLLDRGSVTAAPMLLVLGYAILLPAGLVAGYGRLRKGEDGPG